MQGGGGGWGGFSCIHIEKFSKINTVNYGIFYYTFNLKYMYILLMYESALCCISSGSGSALFAKTLG